MKNANCGINGAFGGIARDARRLAWKKICVGQPESFCSDNCTGCEDGGDFQPVCRRAGRFAKSASGTAKPVSVRSVSTVKIYVAISAFPA